MIRITTTPALIGIKTTPGRMDIRQPKADVRINTEQPKAEIESELPKVEIDQYQCFAEAGLKSSLDLAKEGAQLGRRNALLGIERRARQGKELAAIEKNFNPIAKQAVENAFELFNVGYTYGDIPKSRPIINLREGRVDINIREGKANIDVKINKPIINYMRGRVDIYLRQKNSIKIEYLGKRFNKRI